MIYAFIRSFIGGFGRALMDFYIANSLVINGLLLGYALIVFISHRNYFLALERIIVELGLIKEGEKNKLIRKVNSSDYTGLQWDKVRKGIWFPFISEPKKWTFRFCTTHYIKSEFSLEKINQFIKDPGK
ncbi:MAG: hypothetical protein Q8N39_05120 [Pelolinea sp.]|nr:hypothetical protein [Pelolinea sp.]